MLGDDERAGLGRGRRAEGKSARERKKCKAAHKSVHGLRGGTPCQVRHAISKRVAATQIQFPILHEQLVAAFIALNARPPELLRRWIARAEPCLRRLA